MIRRHPVSRKSLARSFAICLILTLTVVAGCSDEDPDNSSPLADETDPIVPVTAPSSTVPPSLPLDSGEDEGAMQARDATVVTVAADKRIDPDTELGDATEDGAVTPGERVAYAVEGSAGQQMTATVTSTENNASLDVVAPSGDVLASDVSEVRINLAQAGDYRIMVGPTAGTATYQLSVDLA